MLTSKRAIQHAELLRDLTMYNSKEDYINVPAGTVVYIRRCKEHKVIPPGAVVYDIKHYYWDECFTLSYPPISIQDAVDSGRIKILDLTKKGGDK